MSLSAKTDQLLESEEEIGFLEATADKLVDHGIQLSAQVDEACEEATLMWGELAVARWEVEAARTAEDRVRAAEDVVVAAANNA